MLMSNIYLREIKSFKIFDEIWVEYSWSNCFIKIIIITTVFKLWLLFVFQSTELTETKSKNTVLLFD